MVSVCVCVCVTTNVRMVSVCVHTYVHCIYMYMYMYIQISGFHTEGGPWNIPLPAIAPPPPPPEILKFSMVFGHLVCVIKINFVQDCVRSNLRRSKNQNFPGGQVQLLLPTFMSQQGATKRSCTASKGLSRLPLLYFKLCSNTFTTTLSMYRSLLCRPVTPSTYTYTLSMWTQQFVCNIT